METQKKVWPKHLSPPDLGSSIFLLLFSFLNVDSSAQLARGFASTFWTTLSGKNGAKKPTLWVSECLGRNWISGANTVEKMCFFFFSNDQAIKKTPSTKNGLKLFFLVNFPTLLVQMVFQRNPRLKCIGWLGLWIRCCFHRREQKISHLLDFCGGSLMCWNLMIHITLWQTNMVRGKISWICRMYLLYVSVCTIQVLLLLKKWRDSIAMFVYRRVSMQHFAVMGFDCANAMLMKKKKKKKQTGWRQKRQSLTQKKANSLHSFSRINAECTLG